MSALTLFGTLSVISLALLFPTARHGISVILISLVTAIFLIDIALVNHSYWKIIGVILITTLTLPIFYSLVHGGTLLSISLLTLGLIILITGILFNVRSVLLFVGINGLYLGLITYLHQPALLLVDNRWLSSSLYLNYYFEIILILLIIIGLLILAFFEIEASLKQARRSELQLIEDNKVSIELLHDLINPITTVSLAINCLNTLTPNNSPLKEPINHAVKATTRLEKLVALIKLKSL